MNGIPGIARIKSKTARGSSEINLYFDWNGDILQELQLVQARMSQLLSTLPPTAEIRNIERLTFPRALRCFVHYAWNAAVKYSR